MIKLHHYLSTKYKKVQEDTDKTIYNNRRKKKVLTVHNSKKKKDIFHETCIYKKLSKHNIYTKFYKTLIIDSSNNISIMKTNCDRFITDNTMYYSIFITELYDTNLYTFLKKSHLYKINYQDILLSVSHLIKKLLKYYISSDIQFQNILIQQVFKSEKYNVRLSNINLQSINNIRNEQKIIIYIIILLLLFLNSFDIINANLTQHINKYIIETQYIKPFFYSELKDYFTSYYESFFTILKEIIINTSDNKYNFNNIIHNIIYQILSFINTKLKYIKYKELQNLKNKPEYFYDLDVIQILQDLILYFFEGHHIGGGHIVKEVTDDIPFYDVNINYYKQKKEMAKGTYGNIYIKRENPEKVIKITKKPVTQQELFFELDIYKEYNAHKIGIPINSYYFENYIAPEEEDLSRGINNTFQEKSEQVSNYQNIFSPNSKIIYSYEMDKYDSDLLNYFKSYIINQKELIMYEEQIYDLINKMFNTKYICGDIKFNNMLIKNNKIILSDFDYKFCFKNSITIDKNLYINFILFSLICLLILLNTQRHFNYLNINTKLFTNNNFTYLLIFRDKINEFEKYIKQFILIYNDHRNFFISQFYYIYMLYCKIYHNNILDDNKCIKQFNNILKSKENIIIIFKFILTIMISINDNINKQN